MSPVSYLSYLKPRRESFIAAGRCAECGRLREDPTKTRCQRCRVRAVANMKALFLRRRVAGLCHCGAPASPGVLECQRCQSRSSQRSRRQLQELRQEILAHYGRVCVCCGEENDAFLTIDHINGDGHIRRKQGIDRSGPGWYRQIIQAGFPDDLQILCWNCNMAKRICGGYCPHHLV